MELDVSLDLLAKDPTRDIDVAEVGLQLARDEYADLDVEAYLSMLEGMAHEARPHLRGELPAQVAGLCRYLFHEMGFRGNDRNYYDARNSYLNQVLDRRTGIPITLSVIAQAVGTRAGLDIVGVGLPGHFVAKAVAGVHTVLFDPFHGGRVLTKDQCEQLVRKVSGAPFLATTANLAGTPPGLIVQRMLTNLKGVYLRDHDFSRAIRAIERLRQLNPADLTQRRDLGFCLIQAGQPGKAIDHLAAYLAAHPQGEEAVQVQKVLNRAWKEVAMWN